MESLNRIFPAIFLAGFALAPGGAAQASPDPDPSKREVTIAGVVRDNDSNPLVGATVEAVGHGQVVTTDLEGRYSLTLADNPQGFVFLQAKAPAFGSNYSQEYIPQGKYVDLTKAPWLSRTKFIEDLGDTGPISEMEIDPYRLEIQNFFLQRRNGWSSPIIGPNGGSAENSDGSIAVNVPAGAFDQDFRVVVTPLDFVCLSTYGDFNKVKWSQAWVQFETVLVDANNQVVRNHPFQDSISVEIQFPLLAIHGMDGSFYSIDQVAIIEHGSCGYSPQASVGIGWNADAERVTFSLPHFSHWACQVTDETLWHKADRPKRPSPKPQPEPDYEVKSRTKWVNKETVEVLCGFPAGTSTFSQQVGQELSSSWSVAAGVNIKKWLPILAVEVGGKYDKSDKVYSTTSIDRTIGGSGRTYHEHFNGKVILQVKEKKAWLELNGVKVPGTEVVNNLEGRIKFKKSDDGQNC